MIRVSRLFRKEFIYSYKRITLFTLSILLLNQTKKLLDLSLSFSSIGLLLFLYFMIWIIINRGCLYFREIIFYERRKINIESEKFV